MVWTSIVKSWDEHSKESQDGMRWLWGHGKLWWKLDPDQLKTYRAMKSYFSECSNSYERLWVNEWSRRLGKDFMTWLYLREESRTRYNEIYHYGTAFETDINKILIPIIKEIEKDCPPELRLKPQRSKGIFVDPVTNTEIRLIGLDVNPDGIRGNRGDKIVITEVSYVDKIDEAETAYMPMLVENITAERIYNSTPGESTGHKWHVEIVPKAQLSGGYSKRILDSCRRFTHEQIEAAYDAFGGRNSTKSRREFLCEHVGEETKMIIPEWISAKKDIMVDSYPRPEYAHCYVVIDPGQVDLHGNLFFYYDFENDMVVIERAFTQHSPKTSEIAETLAKNEFELWNGFTYHTAQKEFIKNPYLRISDTDLRLIKDLSEDYDMTFIGTRKDDLRSAVNALRLRIQAKKIRILPGAFELTLHLDAGIWDTNRTKFAHVSPVLGHFDLLACAVYGIRNLDLDTNPLPPKAPKRDEWNVRKGDDRVFEMKRDRYGNIIETTKEYQEKIGNLWD